MEGFKTALNAAREAMAAALPWNRSVSALVGFFTNNNYLQQDLQNNPKKAQVLTEFVDYVWGRNALNWENQHPFITADELSHVWNNWKGKRAALFTGKYNEKPWQKNKNQEKLCRKWNSGQCPKQADKGCETPFGLKLKHACNFVLPGGRFCDKDHTRKDHK